MVTLQQILQLREKIKNDPIFCSTEILKAKLWEKENEILLAVRDHQEVSVRSCHASGKTYTAAQIIHWWLLGHEDSIVITTAPTFRQVKEILWREIKSAALGKNIYPKNAVLDTQIDLSDKWFALGLSTDRPDQFQGFHSANLLVVVDEASGVTQDIFQAIDGLSPRRILMIGNPLQNTGRFADSFKNARVHKIAISAFDTPNVKEGRLVIPGLITQADVDRMVAYYGADSDVYRVRVLGEFPKADTDAFIGVDEIAKAMERDVAVLSQWQKKMGVDPARFGDDRTVIVVRQMEKVIRKEIFSGLDTMQISGYVLRIAQEEKVNDFNTNVDVIGIGAGVVDRLKEQGWKVNAVNVAEKAEDYEHYANSRAELYGRVKDWLKTASLSKSEDWYELANMKYKFTSNGQLLLESKEDMKKRGLSSPDVADALMLTFADQRRIFAPVATEAMKPYYPELGI